MCKMWTLHHPSVKLCKTPRAMHCSVAIIPMTPMSLILSSIQLDHRLQPNATPTFDRAGPPSEPVSNRTITAPLNTVAAYTEKIENVEPDGLEPL